MAEDLENPYKWVMPWDLNMDPGSLQFDPAGYFGGLGSAAMNILPPSPTQQPAPPDTGSFLGGLKGSDIAAVLGGAALGLGAPHIGPQALQNFSAINLMQNREALQQQAQARLDLQKQIEKRREDVILAQAGQFREGMDEDLKKIAEQERMRTQRVEAEFFGTPQPPTTMQVGAPPQAPAPQQMGTPQYQPVGGGQAVVPPDTMRNVDPSQGPIRLDATETVDGFTFPGAPAQAPQHVNKSLTHKGMTISKSTPQVDPKTFDTQQAVAELSELVATQDDAVAADPRRAFRAIMSRHKLADPHQVKQELTEAMINAHIMHAQSNDPNLDPKSAYIIAFNGARQDLGLLFTPPEGSRQMSTQVPSIDERRSASIGTPGAVETQRGLNAVEAAREGAIVGARNAADYHTKPYTTKEAQDFEPPPPVGTVPADMGAKGKAPMSLDRQTQISTLRRERSQSQAATESAEPVVSALAAKAQELRGTFDKLAQSDWLNQQLDWADYYQSQVTGYPMTEMGKQLRTYDEFVRTNGTMIGRAYATMKGNMTEQENEVGRDLMPRSIRDIYNNPQKANEQFAVMSDALSMNMGDRNFHLPRPAPNLPLSPFEIHVEQARQQRIATRPDLYEGGAAGQHNAPPRLPQAPQAPPTAPPRMLTPEQMNEKTRIDAEIQQYRSRKK